MRWRHTWPGGDRPHDEVLLVDDGAAGRTVARVDHVTDGPEEARWRWFWDEKDGGSGACATKEAAKAECERRAREAGLTA